MTQNVPTKYDEESRPFWEGLNRGELHIQQCNSCSSHIFYPRSICPHCFSEEVVWKQAEGTGKLYSYTVVHQAFGPFKGEVPFVVGVVELKEGVRMMTRILGEREEIEIDKQVEVVYRQLDDCQLLPFFKISSD